LAQWRAAAVGAGGWVGLATLESGLHCQGDRLPNLLAMAIDVTEATFDQEVVERSRTVPVVVDFWAEWCGPCRTLSPALEAAEAAREGKVVLAKVDVDANQSLAARFGVQGIPAVKAFRDGAVAGEFVGAVPRAKVEELFDSLVPSRADELLAAGDELSLREASELEPRRADIAVALARKRLERGASDEALEAVEPHVGDFAAEGIAARIRLERKGVGAAAFAALDRTDGSDADTGHDRSNGPGTESRPGPARDEALDALLDEIPAADESTREDLRRAIVSILSEGDQADPVARAYRRRLAAALY
jgi:putative thioredoxin